MVVQRILIAMLALGLAACRDNSIVPTPLPAPSPTASSAPGIPASTPTSTISVATAAPPTPSGSPPPPAATATATPRPFTCPVTHPNGSTPPGERPSNGHHGNGALWVALWPDGIVILPASQAQPDESLATKFPWWRGSEVWGALTIAGRRLDAPAPPLTASIPGGYGDTGFQATGITFPTTGCWEVSGTAGRASLTFVLLVIHEPPPASPLAPSR